MSAPVLKNLTGKTWGCTAETFGIAIKSSTQKTSAEIFKHKDHEGQTDGLGFYDFVSSMTVTGAVTAAGALTLKIGDPLTLASEVATLGGVIGGTTLIISVELSRENEGVAELTLECERRPTLTIAGGGE